MDSESICLWTPCTHRGTFDTSAALLAHIYDAHRSSCTRKHRLACKWSHCDAAVMCPGPVSGESMCDVKVHMLQHAENRVEQEEARTSKLFQERMNGRRGRRRTDTSLPTPTSPLPPPPTTTVASLPIPTSPTTMTAGPSSPVPPLRTSLDAGTREPSSAQVAGSSLSPRHSHAHGAGGLPSPSLSPTSISSPALPTPIPTPQTQPSHPETVLSCKWSTCTSPAFPNAAHLLAHVLTTHVRDRARNEWVTKPTQTGGRSTYRRVMCCWKGTDCAKMVSVKGTYAAHFKAHILALVKESDPEVDAEALMEEMSARGAAPYPIPKERSSPKRSKRKSSDLDPTASEMQKQAKRPRVESEGQQPVIRKLEDPTVPDPANPPSSPSSALEEEEDDLDWSLS